MLRVHKLGFGYGAQPIFTDISLELAQGHIVCIAGPNGTGKTTLVKCIAGIFKPQAGHVTVDGTDTREIERKQLATLLGYVPQSIPAKFPATVFETVLSGRRPHMGWRPSKHDMQLAAEKLAQLNLEHLAMRDMASLSGGQAQKVMLARALAQETPYLILDEPTSALDVRHQLDILETITQLARARGLGVLLIIHDLNLAARYSDSIVMLHQGHVHCCGTAEQVITEKTMAEVYGVQADIRHSHGHVHMHVLRSLSHAHVHADATPSAQECCNDG
ncbi:MAG: ABC transporter ATP-binding protein [Brachymonas sp.]|nr:ABC transporter ATP-binding protein [Brachymonas sp.]